MKHYLLGLALLFFVNSYAQQVAKGLTASNGVFIGFYQYTPTDYNVDVSIKHPLIIFLHGIGERGNGTTELSRIAGPAIPGYIKNGNPMRFFWNGKWETFLVLSPQLSTSYGSWQDFYVDEMLKYAKANLRIDPNRIILTGLSLGGGGVWHYASSSAAHAAEFAAIAPVCGTCSVVTACNMANANLPVWAFHAQDDPTVGVGCTGSAISNINLCNPAVKPYMTIYPSGGHGIWDRAYDVNYNWQNPNIYEWFLGKNKGLPVNKRPVAKASSDITISTSGATVSLSGTQSSDPDGHIERYIWRKISGPPYGTFSNAISDVTTITGLNMNGTYQYELTVVDDRCEWTMDTVTVIVTTSTLPNVPPIANAGADQSTYTSATTLDGSNSYDPDGTISAYKWTKITGPTTYTLSNSTVATPALTNLLVGTYKFELEATDNKGLTRKDTVVVLSDVSILPVKILYFNGRLVGNGAELSWATASESGNDRFEVQKSVDGYQFVTIGSVKGFAKSETLQEYAFTDAETPTGTTYYRLKQVSTNGASQNSQIVSVSADGRMRVEFYPNPAHTSVAIVLNDKQKGTATVRLYNMDGKLVAQRQVMKQQDLLSTNLDIHQLTTGIYIMEISVENGVRETRKLIKQ